jgi:hypothetical protein
MSAQNLAMPQDATGDSEHTVLSELSRLSDQQALALYSRLSPRLQWLARRRALGHRRRALIEHHILNQAPTP